MAEFILFHCEVRGCRWAATMGWRRGAVDGTVSFFALALRVSAEREGRKERGQTAVDDDDPFKDDGLASRGELGPLGPRTQFDVPPEQDLKHLDVCSNSSVGGEERDVSCRAAAAAREKGGEEGSRTELLPSASRQP